MTETLTTDAAQVRFLSTVDPQMLSQRRPEINKQPCRSEQVPHRAPAGPRPGPDHAPGPASPLPDGFPTQEAGPFPLPTVGALHVPLAVAGVVELPAADLTRKRPCENRIRASAERRSHICTTVGRSLNLPRWNFSWCLRRAKRDLKLSSQ